MIGIGPDACKDKYRRVLEKIGGTNLYIVNDYASLANVTQNITKLICRKLKLYDFKGARSRYFR